MNAGCLLDLVLPKPLTIGPDLTEIYLSGIFGFYRDAEYIIDADENKIKISNACNSYSDPIMSGMILIRDILNPGYVTTTDSFYLKFTDAD